MKELVIVAGPTASGKTNFALKLAEKIGGEIINADSVQIYKGFDIGSNKGKLSLITGLKKVFVGDFTISPFYLDNTNIVSWGFDIVNCKYNFSVSDFKKIAEKLILHIFKKGKKPILVGGTGLYIDSILRSYNIQISPDWDLRKKLENLSVKELQDMISDKSDILDSLNNSDKNNPRRLIRIIEKLEAEKLSGTSMKKQTKKVFDKYKMYYPLFDLEKLHAKISSRAKNMIDNGFVSEVMKLLSSGCESSKVIDAIGYRQVKEFLLGEIKTQEDLVKEIIFAHKQYIKKQITWFEGKKRGYKLERIVFDESII